MRRIALVGHSLGGLIIHSACAVEHESTWTERLTDVVTLGTPHLGSPVERSIARGLRIAEKVPAGTVTSRSRVMRAVASMVMPSVRDWPDQVAPTCRGVAARSWGGSSRR